MIAPEKRRELLSELYDGSWITARRTAQHCDTLLKQTAGPLTEDQITFISGIRKGTQQLLSLLEELDQANKLGTYLAWEPEAFDYFSLCLLQELRTPLSFILGYVKIVSGPLNDSQQATMQEIQQLGQTLTPVFIDYRMEAVEKGGDRP